MYLTGLVGTGFALGLGHFGRDDHALVYPRGDVGYPRLKRKRADFAMSKRLCSTIVGGGSVYLLWQDSWVPHTSPIIPVIPIVSIFFSIILRKPQYTLNIIPMGSATWSFSGLP